jgi:hypothetical protein
VGGGGGGGGGWGGGLVPWIPRPKLIPERDGMYGASGDARLLCAADLCVYARPPQRYLAIYLASYQKFYCSGDLISLCVRTHRTYG